MFERLFLLAALASLSLPITSAQIVGGPLVKGDLSVWCIFDFVYIAIAALCLIPIFRLQAHRSPFIALFAATLFTVIQCSVEIAYISTSVSDVPETVSALSSIIFFFGNWSSPLLYFALCLLLLDRYKKWQPHAAGSQGLWAMDALLFRFMFGMFFILMLLSTISSALFAAQNKLFAELSEQRFVTSADIQRLNNEVQAYLNANYVFSAFWFFSAVCIAVLSIYVYRSAKHARINDKITKTMLFVVIPLYVLGMIASVVFTIFFSPSVVITTEMELEDLQLANDVTINVFYAAISAAVLALGLRGSYWRTPDQVVALANLGAPHAGTYLELEDPPVQK